jgi:hypothetical protein
LRYLTTCSLVCTYIDIYLRKAHIYTSILKYVLVHTSIYTFRDKKIFPVHAMKAYRGSRCVAPSILNLGARWKWAVHFTPLPLDPLGKAPGTSRREISIGLGACFDVLEQRKSLFLLTGIRTPSRISRKLRPCSDCVTPARIYFYTGSLIGSHAQTHGKLSDRMLELCVKWFHSTLTHAWHLVKGPVILSAVLV